MTRPWLRVSLQQARASISSRPTLAYPDKPAEVYEAGLKKVI